MKKEIIIQLRKDFEQAAYEEEGIESDFVNIKSNSRECNAIIDPVNKIITFEMEALENNGYRIFYVQDGEKREIEFNAKTEIQILSQSNEPKSVLLTLTEIRTDNLITYTAFLQNIEVELF